MRMSQWQGGACCSAPRHAAGGALEVLDLQAVAAQERQTVSPAHSQKGLSGSSSVRQQQSRRHKTRPPVAAAAAAAGATAAAAAAGAPMLQPVSFSECERLAMRAAAAAKRRRENYKASQPSLTQQLLFGVNETTQASSQRAKNIICSSSSISSISSTAFAPWQLEVVDEQLRLLGVSARQKEKSSAAVISAAPAATPAAPAASTAAANRRSSRVAHAKQLSDAAAAAAAEAAAVEAAVLPWEDWRSLCLELQKDPWAIGFSLSPSASDELQVYIHSSNEKAKNAAAEAAAAVAAAAAAAAATPPTPKKTSGSAKSRVAAAAAAAAQQQQQQQPDAVVQEEQQGAPVKELRQFLLQQQWTLRSPEQIREAVECLYTRAQQRQYNQSEALAAATQARNCIFLHGIIIAIQLSLFGKALKETEAPETRAPPATAQDMLLLSLFCEQQSFNNSLCRETRRVAVPVGPTIPRPSALPVASP
ncbi:hypothetical protein Emag_003336 [Eimeria magna]